MVKLCHLSLTLSTHLSAATRCILHRAPGDGGGDGVTGEEGAEESTGTVAYQLLQYKQHRNLLSPAR